MDAQREQDLQRLRDGLAEIDRLRGDGKASDPATSERILDSLTRASQARMLVKPRIRGAADAAFYPMCPGWQAADPAERDRFDVSDANDLCSRYAGRPVRFVLEDGDFRIEVD